MLDCIALRYTGIVSFSERTQRGMTWVSGLRWWQLRTSTVQTTDNEHMNIIAEKYIPVQSTYLYKVHTCTEYIPVQSTYLYRVHTCTRYIPVQSTYLYRVHTCTEYIPVQSTYLYKVHTCTTYAFITRCRCHFSQVDKRLGAVKLG